MSSRVTFPRQEDERGWAWGLKGAEPMEIWERFSPAYEAQAEMLLSALACRWSEVGLDWAGSQDGEAAIAKHDDGTLAFCHHLEDPQAARELADAIVHDRLDEFLNTRMQRPK